MYTYTFEKCSPEKLPMNRSLIRNVYEYESAPTHSLFIGQVLTLFGETDYQTTNVENMFSCAVCGKIEGGQEVYLEIYYGPSGPAIGGGNEWCDKTAAFQLSELIMAAQPTDYEWTGIYQDTSEKVIMGVKNGEPYYRSRLSLLCFLDNIPLVYKIKNKFFR